MEQRYLSGWKQVRPPDTVVLRSAPVTWQTATNLFTYIYDAGGTADELA